MDSIREKIIQEIDYALSQLLTANDFNCNCGANRERGRKSWEDADAPCMTIFPGFESGERASYGGDQMVMPVRVEIFDNRNESITTSEQCEKMLADLREVMRRASPSLIAGFVEDIQYTGGGFEDYPKESVKTIGVVALYDITYQTKLGDPYKQ